MAAVYDHLVTVLTDKFEVDAEEIRPDMTLAGLELDSLAIVELYVTLQEHWGVPLAEDDSAADLTVEQVAQAVTAQLPAGDADRDGAPR
ncbi:acyl carrier protein [Streptomyces pinistramenti]|uniref:acyl carrier protein n=1 Tax=Streptomyces pinistramenti TaxID=2884812 RepID=UPI001D060B0D|nr:phosphopantetheine-binding protein [Streptomyces pinistramenti]MCB5908836.1 phosphopantetheine-binding protein [Streptomyces pinistramenti]